MGRNDVIKEARETYYQWQTIHNQLITQSNNRNRKSKLLYEEHQLEKHFNGLLENYWRY